MLLVKRTYFCNECKGTLSVKQREVILARHRRKIYIDYKDRPRVGHLKRTYSITASEYSIMLEQQGNVCAICKKPETAIRNGKLQLLAVDHCHSSGKIRALLCHKCNQGLGAFHDDPLLLRAAAEYIEEF